MKSICALFSVLTLVVGSTVFGGETFSYGKAMNLNKAKNFGELKTYVEQTTPTENFRSKIQYMAAKLIVMVNGDKTVAPENIYTAIDQMVDQSKLTQPEKTAARVGLYNSGWWWIGQKNGSEVQKKRIELLKGIANTDECLNLLAVSYKATDVWAVFKHKANYLAYSNQLVKVCPVVLLRNVVNNKSISKESKLDVVESFAEVLPDYNVTIKDVDVILAAIGKLSDPIFEESVRNILVVLNKKCYPNIDKQEDWKKATVKLHLIMKSYGL